MSSVEYCRGLCCSEGDQHAEHLALALMSRGESLRKSGRTSEADIRALVQSPRLLEGKVVLQLLLMRQPAYTHLPFSSPSASSTV